MHPGSPVAMVVLAMALLTQAGCGSSCSDTWCPPQWQHSADAASGDAEWQLGAQRFVSRVTPPEVGSTLRCAASIGGATHGFPGAGESDAAYVLTIDCVTGAGRSISTGADLGDLRQSAVGPVKQPPRVTAFLVYDDPCAAEKCGRDPCAVWGLPADDVHATIVEAVGGQAPEPAVVTADFRRTVRLTVAIPAVRGVKTGIADDGDACTDTAQLTASVEVTVTAAHMSYEAGHRCKHCLL